MRNFLLHTCLVETVLVYYILVLKQLSSMFLDWNIFLIVGVCVWLQGPNHFGLPKSLYMHLARSILTAKHSELVKGTRVHFFILFVGTHSRKNAKQNTVLQLFFVRSLWGLSLFSMILMTLAFAMPSLWKIMLKARKWPALAFQYIVWIPAGGKRQKPEADSTRDKMLGWILPWETNMSPEKWPFQ